MSEDFATAVAEYEQDLGIRPGTLCAYAVNVRAGVLGGRVAPGRQRPGAPTDPDVRD